MISDRLFSIYSYVHGEDDFETNAIDVAFIDEGRRRSAFLLRWHPRAVETAMTLEMRDMGMSVLTGWPDVMIWLASRSAVVVDGRRTSGTTRGEAVRALIALGFRDADQGGGAPPITFPAMPAVASAEPGPDAPDGSPGTKGDGTAQAAIPLDALTIHACMQAVSALRREVPYDHNRHPCAVTKARAVNAIRKLATVGRRDASVSVVASIIRNLCLIEQGGNIDGNGIGTTQWIGGIEEAALAIVDALRSGTEAPEQAAKGVPG